MKLFLDPEISRSLVFEVSLVFYAELYPDPNATPPAADPGFLDLKGLLTPGLGGILLALARSTLNFVRLSYWYSEPP